MATQIVMDQTGDTRHYFNADETEALSKAEERFNLLTTIGFTAAVRDAAGEPTVTRSFDPTAEETLFFPRLVVRAMADFRHAPSMAFVGGVRAQGSSLA
jgi:hypothetical protein